MTGATAGFDAVVLAGGTSRRLGGGDKTALCIGGVPLLDRVLSALDAAGRIVVVGDERPTSVAVHWAREHPAGAGPAAAAAAGVSCVRAPVVVLLAGDLPLVRPATIEQLVNAARPAGVVLADADGRPQWLLGAWPTRLLTLALAGDQTGASLRAALTPLGPAVLTPPPGRPDWLDCDDPDDLTTARELLDAATDSNPFGG